MGRSRFSARGLTVATFAADFAGIGVGIGCGLTGTAGVRGCVGSVPSGFTANDCGGPSRRRMGGADDSSRNGNSRFAGSSRTKCNNSDASTALSK